MARKYGSIECITWMLFCSSYFLWCTRWSFPFQPKQCYCIYYNALAPEETKQKKTEPYVCLCVFYNITAHPVQYHVGCFQKKEETMCLSCCYCSVEFFSLSRCSIQLCKSAHFCFVFVCWKCFFFFILFKADYTRIHKHMLVSLCKNSTLTVSKWVSVCVHFDDFIYGPICQFQVHWTFSYWICCTLLLKFQIF